MKPKVKKREEKRRRRTQVGLLLFFFLSKINIVSLVHGFKVVKFGDIQSHITFFS